MRGAGESVEAVRLLRLGRFERRERLLGHAAIEQHEAVKLARRRERSGRDRMLLGLVLSVGRRAHGFQRFVVFAFRVQHPGSGDLPLDVDDLSPIAVLGLAQLVAQLGELGDVGRGGIRLAGARGPERPGKMRDRHYEVEGARPDRQL